MLTFLTRMLFSQRYIRALEAKRLTVEIPEAVRRKLWSWLSTHNDSLRVQRDPNDNWTTNSSILEETELDLWIEHGWNDTQAAPHAQRDEYLTGLRSLFEVGEAFYVLDALELISTFMSGESGETYRRKVNETFNLHECPWRLSDGQFFKLDGDFVGAQMAADAHDALAANNFTGAAEEYAKARRYLGSSDIREAIYFAGHSYESVMSVLTGLKHANADRLTKELLATGYFDDLPETVRAGFSDHVMKALPFLRNKLGGHGQGADILIIPKIYGDLAIQLAAAFHNFLISKHLERRPPKLDEPSASKQKPALDDEIPF